MRTTCPSLLRAGATLALPVLLACRPSGERTPRDATVRANIGPALASADATGRSRDTVPAPFDASIVAPDEGVRRDEGLVDSGEEPLRPVRWQPTEALEGLDDGDTTAMRANAQLGGEPIAWGERLQEARLELRADGAGDAGTLVLRNDVDRGPPEGFHYAIVSTRTGALAIFVGRRRSGGRDGVTDLLVRSLDARGYFIGPVRRVAELSGSLEALTADAGGDTVWIAGRAVRSVGVFVFAVAVRADARLAGNVQRVGVIARDEVTSRGLRVHASADGGASVLYASRTAPLLASERDGRSARDEQTPSPPHARWSLARIRADHRIVALPETFAHEYAPTPGAPAAADRLLLRGVGDAIYASVTSGSVPIAAVFRPQLAPSPVGETEPADEAVAIAPDNMERRWRLLRLRAGRADTPRPDAPRPWEFSLSSVEPSDPLFRVTPLIAWTPLGTSSLVCTPGGPALRLHAGTNSLSLALDRGDLAGWQTLLAALPSRGPSARRCGTSCALYEDSVARIGATLVRFDGARLRRFGCRAGAIEPVELNSP